MASAWRAGKIRKGVPPEVRRAVHPPPRRKEEAPAIGLRQAPRAGCVIQCFHNSLAGFADWALLRVPPRPPRFRRARGGVTPRPRRDVDDGGGWRVAVRTQKTRSDVALRHFSDEKLVMSLGQLLERYNEVRVNSSDAPKSLFSDCWTPWNDRDAEACYVELRRRLAASSPGRSPSPGDTISVADNERVLCCVLECGGDYAGAPSSLPRPRRLFFVLFRRRASLGLFYVGGARASGRRTRAAARTRTCRSGSSWRPSTT